MSTCWEDFLEHLARMDAPRVLELGTRRWQADRSTATKLILKGVNPKCHYTGVDFLAGEDVDVVADAHHLDTVFKRGQFDAFVCRSVLEHCERPWVVAQQLFRVISVGGIGFLQSHQTFPIHGYPGDYCRFSAEALAIIFGDAGWQTLRVAHDFACKVLPLGNYWPHASDWNFEAQSWLNVDGLFSRVEKTP